MKTIELITKTKTFFGRVAKLNEYNQGDETEYIVSFNNKEEVEDFYKKLKEICYKTNFGCDPYEWAAYGYFNYKDVTYLIGSPIQKNGDINWYSYPDSSKRYAIITMIDIEKIKK